MEFCTISHNLLQKKLQGTIFCQNFEQCIISFGDKIENFIQKKLQIFRKNTIFSCNLPCHKEQKLFRYLLLSTWSIPKKKHVMLDDNVGNSKCSIGKYVSLQKVHMLFYCKSIELTCRNKVVLKVITVLLRFGYILAEI